MSIFSQIQRTKVGSNTFDLTHDRKQSGMMGKLMPIMVMDLVPGDQVKIKSNIFTRFAPLIAPVMHRVSVYCHFFFVPNRILWDNWEKFITGGEDGLDTSVWPYFQQDMNNAATSGNGTLADYLGLPASNGLGTTTLQFSALPFAAYQAIYNEYYRDQNLIDPIDFKVVDGANSFYSTRYNVVRNRAWQHDYFTSALPWTQRGPEAMLPLSGDAPVYLDEDGAPFANPQYVKDATGTEFPFTQYLANNASGELRGTDTTTNPAPNPPTPDVRAYLDPNGTMIADLSQATSSSINDLRRAIKLQEWMEKSARGGARYIEQIAVHFGVQSSDKRLQRPEFLGGISAPVQISEVLQQSSTDATTPQGNMAGHAMSIGSGDYVGYYAEEHGYLMGIMSIMPVSAYQQGVARHWTRSDKFDYYWPEFAHIGEQPVVNKEVFLNPDSAGTNEDIFGYVPRYAEYKFFPSSVHGDFRSTLDFWHMGRKFATKPALNKDFIEMDYQEVDRIFAVQDGTDNMWCHILNEVQAKRKMPVFGTPKF